MNNKFFHCWLVLFFLSVSGTASQAQAQEQADSNLETWIKQQVEHYLHQELSLQWSDQGEWRILQRSQTSIAHLGPCEQALINNQGSQWLGSLRLRIQCQDPSSWQLFWPVEVEYHTQVVSLAHAVRRGQPLTQDDLRMQRANLADLRQGYVLNMDQALGQSLSRHGQAGLIINPRMLNEPNLVERGDELDLIVRGPGIEIKARAQAMSSGKAMQQINLRNLSTNQVVRAQLINSQLAIIQLSGSE